MLYQHLVAAHAALITAPTDPPPGVGADGAGTIGQVPSSGFSITNASLNWGSILTLVGVVSFVLLCVFALGLMSKPRKTSLGEAGKASGVMGIGLGWLGIALVLGAGTLIGLLGGFVSSFVSR